MRSSSPSGSACRPSACAWCRATPTASRPAPAPAARARSRSAASSVDRAAQEARRAAQGARRRRAGGERRRSRDRRRRGARRRHRPRRSRLPISPRIRARRPRSSRAADEFSAEPPTYPNGTHIAEVEIDPGDRRDRDPAITSWSTISAPRSIRCCSPARCMAAPCRASARR